MADACKRSQVRQRSVYPKSAPLAVAQKLHNQPDLQWRTPGQREGLLAMIGLQPAKQVMVVLRSSSGKSLIFIVGTAAADARTTILILPAVALRELARFFDNRRASGDSRPYRPHDIALIYKVYSAFSTASWRMNGPLVG
jgi:hypothetical protein